MHCPHWTMITVEVMSDWSWKLIVLSQQLCLVLGNKQNWEHSKIQSHRLWQQVCPLLAIGMRIMWANTIWSGFVGKTSYLLEITFQSFCCIFRGIGHCWTCLLGKSNRILNWFWVWIWRYFHCNIPTRSKPSGAGTLHTTWWDELKVEQLTLCIKCLYFDKLKVIVGTSAVILAHTMILGVLANSKRLIPSLVSASTTQP